MNAPSVMSRQDPETGEPTGDWAPARMASVVLLLFAFAPYPAMLFGFGPELGVLETLGLTAGFLGLAWAAHTGRLGGLAPKGAQEAVSDWTGQS